jgi:hypothetical protein
MDLNLLIDLDLDLRLNLVISYFFLVLRFVLYFDLENSSTMTSYYYTVCSTTLAKDASIVHSAKNLGHHTKLA